MNEAACFRFNEQSVGWKDFVSGSSGLKAKLFVVVCFCFLLFQFTLFIDLPFSILRILSKMQGRGHMRLLGSLLVIQKGQSTPDDWTCTPETVVLDPPMSASLPLGHSRSLARQSDLRLPDRIQNTQLDLNFRF